MKKGCRLRSAEHLRVFKAHWRRLHFGSWLGERPAERIFPVRPLAIVFGIGLALATMAEAATAQNTLLLGRAQAPRLTTRPLPSAP
jgi:hypothetical protein